jgi:hypothetical protein
MDTSHWLIFALGAAVVSGATWLACHWWYGRQAELAERRLQKSEKARLFSAQQTHQARKQIALLQKDLAAQQKSAAQAQLAKQRSQRLEEVLKAAAQTESRSTARPPAHGFADTQPMV